MNQSSDVASLCASLVMYDGKIVQGSSTSMVIAFYAYQEMFEELAKLANQFQCVFTVYVDDITYSSINPFDSAELEKRISQIMSAYGHKVKRQKVRSYGSNKVKRVTGVILNSNHQMLIPNALQEEIYSEFKEYLVQRELNEHELTLECKRISLQGKINAARQIIPNVFPEINRIVRQK